jgi:hypothetical protein
VALSGGKILYSKINKNTQKQNKIKHTTKKDTKEKYKTLFCLLGKIEYNFSFGVYCTLHAKQSKMASCINYKLFLWTDVPIVSKPFTVGELLSDELKILINRPEIMDKELTDFQNVPCTGLYLLSSKDEKVSMTIFQEQFIVEGFEYDDGDGDINIELDCLKSDWVNNVLTPSIHIKEKNKELVAQRYQDENEHRAVVGVNRELMESIRVQCSDGQIADINGDACKL